ncbi:hypothetical protein C9374_008471 [Naegleria lovaniensis]|uniref:Rubisco LSMT substrate-binding domain-containing protein n=1 Tax=Naegleria lovaniensis TaxID=51637 RepID=A0AA88KHZ1_NAELO|nr:uncharacterized protein C9374_008471 [Naegleria lovaniensis]KAG2378328.1 hypothetical protein C9374_008471 [Naegleria lovaniensis]
MSQQEKIQAFVDWAAKVGGFKHEAIDLKFINDEEGMSGTLNSDIEASEEHEETLLSIPLDICLNFKNMSNEFKELISELEQFKDDQLDDGQELTTQWKGTNMFENRLVVFYLFLIHELFVMKESSIYFPYLDMLPQNFTTAIYFDEDDLSELRGTNLYKSITSIKDNLNHVFNSKVSFLKERRAKLIDDNYTYERFMWAFSAVWSRVFPIEYECGNNEKEIVPTLLPMVDILNHKFNAKITYFTGSDSRFYLKTRESLKKGDYVYNNYGAKSNDSFLLSYGFVIPDNSEDTLYVQFGISDTNDEELILCKKKYLEDNSLKLGYYLKQKDLPEDMLDAIRICVMDEEDFYFAKQFNIDHHRKSSERFRFNVKNEYNTLRTLRSLFISKRSVFSTSLEEDIKQLRQEKRYNMRNILVYRIGQKYIIDNILKFIDQSMSHLVMAHSHFLSYPKHSTNILDNFNNLFLENSGKIAVEFVEKEGFSVITTQHITRGDTLLVIKSEEMIDADCALDSPVGEYFTTAREENEDCNYLDDEMAVIFYILFELFSSSMKTNTHSKFFNEIVKQLPINQFPLVAKKYEHELEGTMACLLIQKTQDSLLQTFEEIKDCLLNCGLKDEGILTFENFLVAYSIYDLFCVGMETVVPLPTPISSLPHFLREFDDGNLIVKSLVDIEQNTLISNSILALIKPIEEVFLYNIIPLDERGNTCCTYAAEIDLESMESLVTQEKLEALNRINNLSFRHYLRCDTNSDKIVQQLCILLSSHEELANNPQLSLDGFSHRVHSQVRYIVDMMRTNFEQQFITTMEQDEALLKTPLQEFDTPFLQNIIKYRLTSKRIVTNLHC